ncbi:hypothetical protein ACMDB5_02850 [Flavobacterium sp. W1B]|uniref:hypothetical protein n=1 Tax=Flavobacterium sp. W1B TaxID=3394146 RepID=UPI0039BC76CA
MKVKLPVILLFFIFQSGFSQSEKLINGTVLSEQFAVAKVEVSNFNSKKTTITNSAGTFSIHAKVGDEIIFVSKDHDIKKIIINQNSINNNNLIIILNLKPEQLDEVLIAKIPTIKLSKDLKWEQQKRDQLVLEKAASTLKIAGYKDGTIENPMDFMRIGGMILGLFAKEKEKVEKKAPKIEFIALAKSICEPDFFSKTLKLQADEIALFLYFCEADSKSKSLLENANTLSVMDFLSNKNKEFQKLKEFQK